MPELDLPHDEPVTPSWIQRMERPCAAVCGVVAALCAAATYCVIYLSMNGDLPSLDLVLRRGPGLICELLRACSP
ncbi:hypothetical protein [Hydrogenophaga sp.]|uniref:hypothetical protein n=1 Tax=Hydrogenophaga sp. TaxID=1904254 RepID=UPI003D14F40B